jgi:Dolichyl-phosphate-mannose-protein mannosyltransferase
MKEIIQKKHRLFFYGIWLLLALIQAGFTELQDDEAYYWVYSHYLDWGYFDHPPMIAILIKLGYSIFPNQLGVRLFPLLLNIFTLVIIEKLIDKKNPFLFYTIVFSIAAMQVGGVMAVPDIPLIFFTALFFLCYKNFIASYSIKNTLLLGITMALLMYSKYHGVLIIFFTLLSNLKLLSRYPIYITGAIALILFAPHLYWQYGHDWVSIRYHLFESNVNRYKSSFTIDYLLGQFLLAGPVAGFILLPAVFWYKPAVVWQRAVRYTTIGIYFFFLLSSFRGKVEANWTSPVFIGLIVLSHAFFTEKKYRLAISGQRWLLKLLPVTLLIVLFARIVMLVDILPVKAVKERFHSWNTWPAIMKEKTNRLPVVFDNSYQRASKYWFYTGQMTYSLNNYRGRRNNYNFWPVEDSLLGKPVYLLDIYDVNRLSDSLQTPIGEVGYRYDSSFISFAKIKIEPAAKIYTISEGDVLVLNCRYIIPDNFISLIKNNPSLRDTTRIGIFNNNKWVADAYSSVRLSEMVDKGKGILIFRPGVPKGKYIIRLAVNQGIYKATHNSGKIELVVK